MSPAATLTIISSPEESTVEEKNNTQKNETTTMRNLATTNVARISRAMLPSLEHGPVSLPKYQPQQVSEGIVHLGVGNFFRSHFAKYMDDLLNTDFDNHKNWGILGAGVMHWDVKKRETLQEQDYIQTIVEKDGDSVSASLICPMTDYIAVDADVREHMELRAKLSSPSIKIVSMTVTEGGYYLDDGQFNTEDPDIKHDIEHPNNPHTVFGLIVEALKKRREAGVPPFTIMSCDNIPHNGDVARKAVLGLARAMDADLADWIEKNGAFPNSMVDRITPATNDAQINFIKETYGYDDQAPVFCEPFRQWVIQDNFSMGRPKWDQLESVSFVEDVSPFETMKLRILNGGHASLSYPAALLSVEFVHEAMEHPVIGPFLDTLERNEIIPNVPPVPDTDLVQYWDTTSKRFSNPTLQDTIDRNCFDGSNRQPKFIVPTAASALENGTDCSGLALVSALWCRYCQGRRESGEAIQPSDKQWNRLSELAQKAKTDPTCWLGMSDVYGKVGKNKVFQEKFAEALKSIEVNGVEGAMQKYIDSHN